jgi:hypothetical protein
MLPTGNQHCCGSRAYVRRWPIVLVKNLDRDEPCLPNRRRLSDGNARFADHARRQGGAIHRLGGVGGDLRGVSEGLRLFSHRSRLLGKPSRLGSLVARRHSERVRVLAGGVHFSELLAHHAPLQESGGYGSESEKRYRGSQTDHPSFAATDFVFKSLYLLILLCVGFALCVAASRIIFRCWNVCAVGAARHLYPAVLLILIHALSLFGG